MQKLSLDDVGKTIPVLDGIGPGDWAPNIFIVMGVQASDGGTCFIFGSRQGSNDWPEIKCKAIRAFMEQHFREQVRE